jgi:hypothetical protein
LILKADVCCLRIWCTISGKVEDAISFKVKLYQSWTRFPLFSWVWMVFQCLKYSILVSCSSGNIPARTTPDLFIFHTSSELEKI